MCGMIHHFINAFSAIPGSSGNGSSGQSSGSQPFPQLLLIVILDSIGDKEILRNFISPTPELEARFDRYVEIVGVEAVKEDFARAFLVLQASGFWHLAQRKGEEQESVQEVRGTVQLRNTYFGARFSDTLYPLLVMEPSRNRLRQILVEGYFSSTQAKRLQGAVETMKVRNERYEQDVAEVFDKATFIRNLGIHLLEVSPGKCSAGVLVVDEHLQHLGRVHGGVISSLAGHAALGAAISVVPGGEIMVAPEFTFTMFRSVNSGKLEGRAKVLKSGALLVFVEAEVFSVEDEQSLLIAKGSFTFTRANQ